MKYISPIIVALLTASAANADNCDRTDLTGFDSVYCFSKVYIGEDTRLNEAYNELRTHLSADEKSTLLQAQRGWIAKRNDMCMVDPHTVNVNCALNQTRNRAEFLEARITECKTVGCATSQLSRY